MPRIKLAGSSGLSVRPENQPENQKLLKETFDLYYVTIISRSSRCKVNPNKYPDEYLTLERESLLRAGRHGGGRGEGGEPC